MCQQFRIRCELFYSIRLEASHSILLFAELSVFFGREYTLRHTHRFFFVFYCRQNFNIISHEMVLFYNLFTVELSSGNYACIGDSSHRQNIVIWKFKWKWEMKRKKTNVPFYSTKTPIGAKYSLNIFIKIMNLILNAIPCNIIMCMFTIIEYIRYKISLIGRSHGLFISFPFQLKQRKRKAPESLSNEKW